MRLRWPPIAVFCAYATAVLVAAPFHLSEEHVSEGHADHDHGPDLQESGHDHPAVEHEQTGVKAPSGVSALIPKPCTILDPQIPTSVFVFVPPESPPRSLDFAEHIASRAPPGL